jgi:hypothetical protein
MRPYFKKAAGRVAQSVGPELKPQYRKKKKKIDQRPEQIAHQRKHTDGKKAYKRMLNICNREFQIKMRHHYTLFRMAKTQNTDKPNAGKGLG